jgi:hypothetical protein
MRGEAWMAGTRLRQSFAGLQVLGPRSFSEDGKPGHDGSNG